MSAIRAGFAPHAIDLFADRDLRAIAPASRVARESYPDGLEALASQAPDSPWMYTGALENHPDLVDRIALARPLWGNPGTVVRAVRDPFAVAEVLRDAGLPCPAVRAEAVGLPDDGSWLVKPLASGGGQGVNLYRGGSHPVPDRPHYYQQKVDGLDLAAIFVAHRERVRLFGVTQQVIGGAGAPGPFAYRGSLGPWPLSMLEREAIEAMGVALASAFGLRGIFGVDLILRGGAAWPVEVNPRYTASVEVLEMALGVSILREHARAFDSSIAVEAAPPTGQGVETVGKLIVFAPRDCRFPRGLTKINRTSPRLADLPEPWTFFEAGEPVLTLIERGGSLDDCWRELGRRRGSWTRRLTCEACPFELDAIEEAKS